MIKRSTWIVLAVFAVFVVLAIWFRGFAEHKTAETPTPAPTQPALFSFSSQDVRSLQVQDDQGNRMSAVRDQGAWKLEIPSGQQADAAQIEMALTSLLGLTVSKTLEESDLGQYGLDTPTAIITLTIPTGQYVIRVGDPGPSSVYYIQLNGGAPRVVPQYALAAVVALAATPPVVATPTPEMPAALTPTPAISPTVTTPFTVTLIPYEGTPPAIMLTPNP